MDDHKQALIFEYFEKFRNLRNEIVSMNEKVNEISETIKHKNDELYNMQQIISMVICEDIDPVEAKLRMDEKTKSIFTSYEVYGNNLVNTNISLSLTECLPTYVIPHDIR